MRITVINFLTVFCICSWRLLQAFPDTVKLGGIFEPQNRHHEIAFRYAVEAINSDKRTLPRTRLLADIDRLPADDSFHASKKVCQLLRSGVAGIFGPKSEKTASHVQSICDAMEVPHIETRWDFKLTRDAYSINLYPYPESLGQAYYDIISALNWKAFVILYDSNDGLVRMQSLLKNNDWKVTIRQMGEGDDWRPLMKKIKKSQETKFVIDVAEDKIYPVLKQASQIGLMREYHSYFITSLDLHLVDLEDFRYGGTNITALRIIDPNKPESVKVVEDWQRGELRFGRHLEPHLLKMTTESALIYDAVNLFAKALDNLDQSSVVEIKGVYCEGGKPWQHGNSLINIMKWYGGSGRPEELKAETEPFPNHNHMRRGHQDMYHQGGPGRGIHNPGLPRNPYQPGGMRPYGYNTGMNPMYPGNYTTTPVVDQVQVYGMTGMIKLDQEGFRSDFQLEITELDQKIGLKKVGVWTKEGKANYTRNLAEVTESISSTLQNKTMIVTIALTSPYTMLKESTSTLKGNNRFEGFCIDLIDEVAIQLGFNYTFKVVSDGKYGNPDPKTGEWNGMIRELLDHEADLAIVDFTITHARASAVDFSMPFMNLGISIIYKKPTKKAPSLFSFMSPFSIDVWIYMATAYLGVSVLLFILARMSPSEWDSPYPCIQDPEELENCFTLQNSLWFIIATFLCQGADIAPRAVSTRIVAGIWWFFTLIMISSYTANLAAFLTVERMDSPIESAEDLAGQTKIKYGCKQAGATFEFFKHSNIPTYQRMYTVMSNNKPTVFTSANDEGVKRVSTSNGGYAFLMESSSIEYEVERKCDLMKVGGLLDSKSYGIALPPGSPYTSQISAAILSLKEKGILHNLKRRWWKERKGGGRCQVEAVDAASSAELGLDNVGGVFVVMASGGAAACFMALCEFLWKARKLAAQEGDSFWEELWAELRFIMKFGDNEKPVRKPKPNSPSPKPPSERGENYSASNYS